ncbi:hypothetical protein CYY_006889 [Polysphondylium violaceum]|uniref:Ankyrin repeat-containing protein n=1 Tax=Polysphondylium violaceum TaxID=133409 RepID=A0A8J4PR77_9MYCE|nr:hypothetical protein CYY_006889 [Polysphondylium violaceum]
MMDSLFRQVVFLDSFLRKKVFQQVAHGLNCRTINYKYCVKLSFLLDRKYYQLIKLKLANKEYLYLDGVDGVKALLALQDIDLFVGIIEQLDDESFSMLGKVDDVLYYCSQQGNYKALQYLLQQKRKQFWKSISFFESICSKGYMDIVAKFKTEMFGFLHPYSYKGIIQETISTKNTQYIKDIFNKNLFNNMTLEDKESVLVSSAETGSIEVFKLISLYFAESFFFFGYRKKDFYTNNLLARLFSAAVKANGLEIYMHLFKTFDLSFLNVYSFTLLGNPFNDLVRHPTEDMINHVMDNNLLNLSHLNQMSFYALQNRKFQVYQKFKAIMPTLKLPSHFRLSYVNPPPFDDIPLIEYIVDTLRTPLEVLDLFKSTENLEAFKYIWGRIGIDKDIYFHINTIISCVHQNNNPDVLLYLYHECGVNFEKTRIWSTLSIPPLCSLKTLRTVIAICPPTLDMMPCLAKALEFFAQRCTVQNTRLFTLMFETMYQLSNDPIHFTGAFRGAIRGGRILTLQYLYDKGLRIPTQEEYTMLLEEAASTGSCSIIKYILENHRQYDLPLRPLTEQAMLSQKYDCVDYLLPRDFCLTIKDLVKYCN